MTAVRRPDGWLGIGGDFGSPGSVGLPVASIQSIVFGDGENVVTFPGGQLSIKCSAADLMQAVVQAQLEVKR